VGAARCISSSGGDGQEVDLAVGSTGPYLFFTAAESSSALSCHSMNVCRLTNEYILLYEAEVSLRPPVRIGVCGSKYLPARDLCFLALGGTVLVYRSIWPSSDELHDHYAVILCVR